MTYFGEIRHNWRYLAAACIGQTVGYSLTNYINNLFTPQLIMEFGWSRSDIALVGAATFLGILVNPVAGRLVDTFGVRRMALVGVICAPLVFLGFSFMTGALLEFFLLSVIQVLLVGGTTSVVIYSRLIANQFSLARGVALGIAATTGPAVAAVGVPFLSRYIDAYGWRAGYVAVASFTAAGGVIAISLIPAGEVLRQRAERVRQSLSKRYGVIVRSRSCQLIIGAVFLTNLSFTMQTSQLKVILLDMGVDSATGSLAVALFAASAICGRLLCGVAFDRFPAYAVAAGFLGLPAVGLSILAAGLSAPVMIGASVLLLGLSLGAEGDVFAYLVMRYFRLEIYSTVLGLVFGSIALAVGLGSLLLSLTLKLSGGFTPFLIFSAVAVFIGSGLFLLLKRQPVV